MTKTSIAIDEQALAAAAAVLGTKTKKDSFPNLLRAATSSRGCRAVARLAMGTVGHFPLYSDTGGQMPRSVSAYRGGFALYGEFWGLQYPKVSTEPKSSTEICGRAPEFVTLGPGMTPGIHGTSKRFAITDHPQIEWRKVKGMRDIVTHERAIVTHEYPRIDYEIVWNALAIRVPEIAAFVRRVLAAPSQT